MIKDSEALEQLIPAALALSMDEQKQQELMQHIAKLATVNADEIIAAEICALL